MIDVQAFYFWIVSSNIFCLVMGYLMRREEILKQDQKIIKATEEKEALNKKYLALQPKLDLTLDYLDEAYCEIVALTEDKEILKKSVEEITKELKKLSESVEDYKHTIDVQKSNMLFKDNQLKRYKELHLVNN